MPSPCLLIFPLQLQTVACCVLCNMSVDYSVLYDRDLNETWLHVYHYTLGVDSVATNVKNL